MRGARSVSTLPIETERLRIRHFTADDWRAVHAYTRDAGVMTYVPKGVMTEEETKQFIAGSMADEARTYAVDLRAEDRLIGHVGFHPWYAPRIYEIGWVFHPHYHGRGYATEAAAALLRYGFESLSVHRVIATCQPENPASWRVMEKLGMQREGHLRKCIYRDETTWWDEYFYAILEEEWFGGVGSREGSRGESASQ
jgi:[ribosomal protein S5]-alanine N-acetyltransferase